MRNSATQLLKRTLEKLSGWSRTMSACALAVAAATYAREKKFPEEDLMPTRFAED